MKKAKLFILFVIVAVVLFDLYLIFSDQESISNVIYLKTKEYKLFVYLTIFLMGHLFWPNNPRCPKCQQEIE